MIRLPESVHAALVADTVRAMARKTPAVAAAISAQRAAENAALMRLIDDSPVPTTAFDLFATAAPPMDLHLHSTPRSRPNHFAEDDVSAQFRQEYCGQFADPPFSVPCPNCTEGHLVDDAHGRGGRCLECGYETWKQKPVYIGVDHSKGKDHTAVVFSHMEGPVRIIDKVITSPAHKEAMP